MNYIFLMFFGCSVEDKNSPRIPYNEGTKLLIESESSLDDAIEKILQSRDQAKTDAELRQHAAFNLAYAYTKKAMELEQSDPDTAVSTYQQAASWFQDAIRITPTDMDARKNLEVVLKRIKLLADQRSQGENSLEKRLERLLEDIRMIRDNMRVLRNEIESRQATQDPTVFKSQFDDLAVQTRILQGDASTILQLSYEERSDLEGKTEENQSDEDKIRMVQLSNLEGHLSLGREEIADSRVVLRKLQIENSFKNLEDAVQRVIRAQEQLMEPIQILQIIAQQQQQLVQQSALLNQYTSLQNDSDSQNRQLPTWFDGDFLGDQQLDLYDRCYEIVQRFEYAVSSSMEVENTEQTDLMMLVQGALPHLQNAIREMKSAEKDLQSNRISEGIEAELESLKSLALAIEYFSDAKTLINITLQTQNELVSLLNIPIEGQVDTQTQSTDISPEEREKEIATRLEQNYGRINRLQKTLIREKEKEQQSLEQNAQGGQDITEAQQKLDEKYSYAEQLRTQAQTTMEKFIGEEGQESTIEINYLEESQHVQKNLEELAKIFYNLIEHMQQLLQDQGKLRDDVVSTSTQEYQNMQEETMLHQSSQTQLLEIAKTISGVLEEQADALQEQGQAEESERYSDAYVEMAMAGDRMNDALENMEDVVTESGGMSHTLDETLQAQQLAMESIAAAIQALQPPQNQDGEDEQNQQDEKMNQQQAEKKKQQAKEREAERKKNQQNQQQEPVAQDW